MKLKKFTIEDIRNMRPCYDPSRYLPEDWCGTALDILNMENAPARDRLWVVLHESIIDDRTMRLFAVWCAREALKKVKDPDPRSVNACNVAERYANGKASSKELAVARAAAEAATWDAVGAVVRDAAWDAAGAEAWNAAWNAAWAVAEAAAQATARAAAWDARVAQLKKMLR
jgi:hypothetical protein